MLADYHDACTRGVPNWQPTELAVAVREADDAGFNVHLHAIGDAAVRSALTAVAGRSPATPRRATLAHVQVISPDDLERLADLDVVLCFQPAWAVEDEVMTELTLPRLGPSRHVQYRMRSALDAGARLSFGSDWPVASSDVLGGIRAAVTRQLGVSDDEPAFHPEERLTLDEALDAATSGVHYQAGTHDSRGSIAPGLAADFVLLDRDIRTIPAPQIADARVVATWRHGERTHPAAAAFTVI